MKNYVVPMLPSKDELDKGPIVLMCDLHDLKNYWQVIQPWLKKGAEIDPLFDAVKATEDIFSGKSQVWVAVNKGKVLGAFCTSILEDVANPGNTCLDVHGLGGKDYKQWREAMGKIVRQWAEHNNCHRVIYKARSKAARRFYQTAAGEVKHVSKCPSTGHEIFEVII